MSIEEKLYLNTKEVADFLQVNEKMVYGLINDKRLPATKVTGKWLFPRKLVERWLESNIHHLKKYSVRVSSNDGMLLIAGSDDPLFQQTMALYHRKEYGKTAFFANLGSMGGIRALNNGQCHIGVCHLLQDDNSEYNFDYARREMEREPVFINFSLRKQGILVARGNPKNIQSVDDFGRDDVTIVNRPLETGTRRLLDYEIARSSISQDDIDGYTKEVARHLDAGVEILTGRADAAPAVEPVASMLNLDFLPLRWERFDLLVDREIFFEEGIQRFLSILQDNEFRQLAATYTGYDLSSTGKMIFPEHG